MQRGAVSHWRGEEVKALLVVWREREVQVRLQSTHRNKAIFQEMARRLELQHGVVRDWRQCRTKYKNLKYDYKVSKSQGRAMRFFAEVDAILQGKDIEDGPDDEEDSPRKGPEGDHTQFKCLLSPITPICLSLYFLLNR
uniref:Myb/SANT-like DNA-binding domain-containing protein n=1 Tax=Electrophorus electricus TaxID=8005 RepID=A0AAY5F1D4_ELEEL